MGNPDCRGRGWNASYSERLQTQGPRGTSTWPGPHANCSHSSFTFQSQLMLNGLFSFLSVPFPSGKSRTGEPQRAPGWAPKEAGRTQGGTDAAQVRVGTPCPEVVSMRTHGLPTPGPSSPAALSTRTWHYLVHSDFLRPRGEGNDSPSRGHCGCHTWPRVGDTERKMEKRWVLRDGCGP